MTPEQIDQLAGVVERIGFPAFIGIVAAIIVLIAFSLFAKRTNTDIDLTKSDRAELIRLKDYEIRMVDARLELERKFTEKSERVKELEGILNLEEHKAQDALDDTRNFLTDLDEKDQQILFLTGEIAKRDMMIADRDEMIKNYIIEKYEEK